jgi:undecaprenyl-diphosphatase
MTMEVVSTLRQQSYELDGAEAASLGLRAAAGDLAGDLQRQEILIVPADLAWRLDAAELRLVRAAARSARPLVMRGLAIGLSRLGNGWVYLLLAAFIVAKGGLVGLRIMLPAGIVALLLHSVYPTMKRGFGRQRPFQTDPQLPSLLPTLDAHSFPSGHTMTLAGVLTPIVMVWPAATISALVFGVGVAWSRVATAHHYPSDVLAGAALGVGVGYPTTALIVSLWS